MKISGFRIELGEIESVLADYPDVDRAVVVVRNRRHQRQLVAYVTTRDGRSAAAADLRRHLADRLPPYMVPAAFVPLRAFPTTASGKLDRRALPEPEGPCTSLATHAPPATVLQKVLADIWKEKLEVDRVGIHDRFFELGGSSLLAIQVCHEINDRLDARVTVLDFFMRPTLQSLARFIEGTDQPPVDDPSPVRNRVQLRKQALSGIRRPRSQHDDRR